jgi:low temperature requirement protein LtrA
MPTREVLRARDNGSPAVTNMELFFDLVYVFAITQLSEALSGNHTARGALETLILFLAVWWAWNYTAWATNWIDPDRAPVALLMVVLMAISLVMSAAIPRAFADRAVPFAVAYVLLQVVRSGFMVWAFARGGRDRVMRRNFAQLLAWSAIAGVVWILGALLNGDARLIVWLIALAVDLGAPMHGFRLPGIGATPMEQWTLAGAHLAERCQLVLMIALGESVLRVGLTFAQQSGSLSVDVAFVAGFIASAALWATYFLRHAERGATAIAGSAEQAARVGRAAYTYAHAVMVAGVIVVAVAIGFTIEHPSEGVGTAVGLTMLGGPALYLAGLVLFKRWIRQGSLIAPGAAIAALAILTVPAVAGANRLVLWILVTLVLATLAVGAARDVDGRRGPTAH